MGVDSRSSRRCLGLIGLGLVGSALATRFLKAGFQVVGYDLDAARCHKLERLGGHVVTSPALVASHTARIVLSLPDSHVVESAVFGYDGIISSLLFNIDIIDTTTGDPRVTVEIAKRVAASGCCYMEACIVGSSRQVAQADAIVVASGSEELLTRCQDVFDTFARHIFHMGTVGKGCETKLVVNLVLGLNRLVLSEGLVLAEALNLDSTKILDVLKSGVSYSRVMDTKGEKMLSGDFQPQAKLSQHLKDVDLILALGKRTGVDLPVSQLHRRMLDAGVVSGLGELDNSAIIEVLRRRLGTGDRAGPK